MRRHHRDWARELTPENFQTSSRTRRSCGIWMRASVHELPGGRYEGIYGAPWAGFGARVEFETLDAALEWANRDQGGVMLVVGDESVDVQLHPDPQALAD